MPLFSTAINIQIAHEDYKLSVEIMYFSGHFLAVKINVVHSLCLVQNLLYCIQQ